MSKLETIFHYCLDSYYPKGKPCLFYPDKYGWQELCHIIPQTKANYSLCKKAFGNKWVLDSPLINVIPGSRAANHEKYTTRMLILPPEAMVSARCAILEFAKHNMSILDIEIINNFMQEVPMLDRLLTMQDQFRLALQMALTPTKYNKKSLK